MGAPVVPDVVSRSAGASLSGSGGKRPALLLMSSVHHGMAPLYAPPEPVTKRDRLAGFGWGAEFEQPGRRRGRGGPAASEAEVVRRALFNAEPDAIDRLEEAVFAAILQTRRLLHVHSERIFLVGCGEGAAVAYWLGLSFPERFAGVVAING